MSTTSGTAIRRRSGVFPRGRDVGHQHGRDARQNQQHPGHHRVGQPADQPNRQRGPPIEDAGRGITPGRKLRGEGLVVALAGVDPLDLGHVQEDVGQFGTLLVVGIAQFSLWRRTPQPGADQGQKTDQDAAGRPGRKLRVTARGRRGGHADKTSRGVECANPGLIDQINRDGLTEEVAALAEGDQRTAAER